LHADGSATELCTGLAVEAPRPPTAPAAKSRLISTTRDGRGTGRRDGTTFFASWGGATSRFGPRRRLGRLCGRSCPAAARKSTVVRRISILGWSADTDNRLERRPEGPPQRLTRRDRAGDLEGCALDAAREREVEWPRRVPLGGVTRRSDSKAPTFTKAPLRPPGPPRAS
jgi:hypothetical protein